LHVRKTICSSFCFSFVFVQTFFFFFLILLCEKKASNAENLLVEFSEEGSSLDFKIFLSPIKVCLFSKKEFVVALCL
jgi:hypothetical protein